MEQAEVVQPVQKPVAEVQPEITKIEAPEIEAPENSR